MKNHRTTHDKYEYLILNDKGIRYRVELRPEEAIELKRNANLTPVSPSMAHYRGLLSR